MTTQFKRSDVDRIRITIKHKLRGLETGLYQGFVGTDGFDISGIRPFEPGDSPWRIHMFASAFADEPMVWEAEPEVAVRMGIVADLSPSMYYGTADGEKVDVAQDVIAAVAYVGSRDGNRVGALIARENVESIPIGQSDRHVGRLLAAIGREKTPDGTNTAFTEALSQYNNRFKQRGLAVVVLGHLPPGSEDHLQLMASRHTVLVVRTIDRRELELEDVGVITLEDPDTGEFYEVDTSDGDLRETYANEAKDEREETMGRVLGSGAEYFELKTEGEWLVDFVHKLNCRRPTRGRRVA